MRRMYTGMFLSLQNLFSDAGSIHPFACCTPPQKGTSQAFLHMDKTDFIYTKTRLRTIVHLDVFVSFFLFFLLFQYFPFEFSVEFFFIFSKNTSFVSLTNHAVRPAKAVRSLLTFDFQYAKIAQNVSNGFTKCGQIADKNKGGNKP